MKIYNQIFIIILIFINSCGYNPIYLEKKDHFSITSIKLQDKNRISFKIKNNLKKYINLENKQKSYAVSIKSNKQIRTTSKDKKGNAKTLEYKISVQMVFSDLDNKYEKTFEETFGYQNRSNKFNLKRYENDIQNNLIEKIVFDINQFLYQLEK